MSLSSNLAAAKIVSVIQGEFAVSANPDVAMSTVLGSCIAACVYDPVNLVGGMNHFLLPEAQNGDGQNVKYGAFLMELLINDLLKIGAQRQNLRAKLIGGAKMSQFLGDIGAKNTQFARRYLHNEGIPVDWESLGGGRARRVHFYPTTGKVVEKFVENDVPIEKAQTPPRRDRRNDVTLF